MTDEIEDYDEELNELEDEVAKGIKQLQGLSSQDDKLKGVKNLQKRLDRGKTLMDGFVIELRELSPSEAAPFKTKQTEHESKLASFKSQLDNMQNDSNRSALGLDANKDGTAGKVTPGGTTAASAPKTETDIKKEADEILDKGAAKQKETLGALDRINRKIGETEEVGTAINAQLAADREKMEQMQKDFEDIDDGIKQSKKLLSQFWRRMQRDNCIRALVVLVLIGVLFVMIWSLVDPNFALSCLCLNLLLGKKKSSASSSVHGNLVNTSLFVTIGFLLTILSRTIV